MRILHAIWFMGLGGAEQQLVQLSAGLVRRGNEVHVITSREAELDGDLVRSGAHLDVMHVTKRDPRSLIRLIAAVRRLRPDVINTWLPPMDLLGAAAARLTGTPWVLSERSAAGCYPPTAMHRMRLYAARSAGAVIANSAAGQEYWVDAGIPRERVAVLPNVVPAQQVANAPPLDPRDDIASGDDVVLFVGRLADVKNIDRVLDGCALAMRERTFHVVLCGDGPLRETLVAHAAALGIGHRVHFLGAVANAWSWMKRSSALIALSTFEGNPNVVQEAIAARLPLILSELDAYRAIASEETALFTAREPAAVARAIVATLSDPEAARRRARRAHETTHAWSADDIAAEYESLYRRSVQQRRRS